MSGECDICGNMGHVEFDCPASLDSPATKSQQSRCSIPIDAVLKKRSASRRAGWRLFSCENCLEVVWMPTRDRFSPSCETCRCGEVIRPLCSKGDESLPVDKMGNLKSPPPDDILRHAHL